MKTLKELEFTHPDKTGGYNLCHSVDLRNEAIEWIKELENPDLSKYNRFKSGLTSEHRLNTINWIKMFFNISEEDLK